MNASALVAKSRRALNTVSTLYMVGPLRLLNPNVATVATATHRVCYRAREAGMQFTIRDSLALPLSATLRLLPLRVPRWQEDAWREQRGSLYMV